MIVGPFILVIPKWNIISIEIITLRQRIQILHDKATSVQAAHFIFIYLFGLGFFEPASGAGLFNSQYY